jgi:toxin YoeB
MDITQIIYTSQAKDDLAYWTKHDHKIVARIEQLIADIKKNPYQGSGKPESLKFARSGYWSRRIDHEHRLVYKIFNGQLFIAQCRYHYDN